MTEDKKPLNHVYSDTNGHQIIDGTDLPMEHFQIEPTSPGGKLTNNNGHHSYIGTKNGHSWSAKTNEQTHLVSCQSPGEAKLVKLVLLVSWASVIFSFVTGILGIVLSVQGKSEALFAYGLDAVLDSLSSIAVVWRFHGKQLMSAERERKACIAIGWAFLISASSLIGRSIYSIIIEAHESKQIEMYEVFAGICASVSILLATAKVILGYKTDSMALTNDSIITYVGAASCLAGVAGLEIYVNNSSYWYLDSVFGVILGLFLFVFGIRLLVTTINLR